MRLSSFVAFALACLLSSAAQADLVFTFNGTVTSAGLGYGVNDSVTYSFRTTVDPSPTTDVGPILYWSSTPGVPFFTNISGTGLAGSIDPNLAGLQIGTLRPGDSFSASIQSIGAATGLTLNGNSLAQLDFNSGGSTINGLFKSTATGVSLENALNLGTFQVNAPLGIRGLKAVTGEEFAATFNNFTVASGNVAAVPEPSSVISLSIACVAYGLSRRKRLTTKVKCSGDTA